MFGTPKTRIYTVHVNPDKADPSDRVELVREGFNVWALLFNMVWLLLNRLWLAAACYLAIVTVIVYIAQVFHLSEISVGALQLMLQVGLGFVAYDLRRAKLARKGYAMTAVVAAESPLNAERRYYDAIA